MNIPLVNVIMVTYNHEKYIAEAIQGVLMQVTEFSIEFIIANDASSDNTHSIVTQLAVDTSSITIKYINHPVNIGMMPNFIFALKQCQSKYIALCEGDDYWTDPLKLQKQVDFLEENDQPMGCFHNTEVINEMEANPQLKPWRNYSKSEFTLRDTLSTLALFHTSSFMFRTEALTIPKWFTKIQSGDMALFTIIASQGPFYRLNENMSVYRKNEKGITTSISSVAYHSNRIKLFKYFQAFLNGRENEQLKIVSDYHKEQLNKIKRKVLKNKIRRIFRLFISWNNNR